MNNNKRIAKNAIMLYIRMFAMMGITLYTSRVILQILGVDDFGIYNLIGGIVVLFSFINGAMVASTQRFLNFELGKNNTDEAQKIFSASLNIHLIIAFVFILLAETIGLWFLNTYLNIPVERKNAANWVYQFTIITSAINIIRAPYNASIIAYERMSFYAYVSIFEVVFKLAIVFILLFFSDKLIIYAILITIISAITLWIYVHYCRSNFKICTKHLFKFDRQLYSALTSFSIWSLFGAFANVGANQGLNIILNIFFGVGLNAALGVANQINNAIYQFVSNFQTAFNPQIIKLYAANERDNFLNLILRTSKYSYFLLFLLVLPFFICCQEIMELWLIEVPAHSVYFCRLLLLFSLVDALQGPLWISAQATGKIKNYQLIMSTLILSNIPISYIILKLVPIPELSLLAKVAINIITAIVRVLYLNKLYGFPVWGYIKNVLFICFIVSVASSVVPILISYYIHNNLRIIASIFASLVFSALVIYSIGLKSYERDFVKLLFSKIINRL